MEHGTDSEAELIRECLKDEELSKKSLDQVINIVRDSGGLAYTREKARDCSDKALACLDKIPASNYRDALEAMVEFSKERKS
jgi:octaprenyl-diphosphate synthase